MGMISFEADNCTYRAKNAKIDSHNLSFLESSYEEYGIGFENDYFENSAVMYWDESVDTNIVDEAKADFTNCIVPI